MSFIVRKRTDVIVRISDYLPFLLLLKPTRVKIYKAASLSVLAYISYIEMSLLYESRLMKGDLWDQIAV